MQFKFPHPALTAVALAGLSAFAAVTPATAQSSDITRDAVVRVLRENPEIVLEALQMAREQEQAEQTRRIAEQASPVAKAIIAGDDQIAFIGDPNGEPVIEFFDYNCGFCKRFHAETATPLLADGGTKLLLVHTPILSDGSHRMAELAAAANLQGKFKEAHEFLIEHSAQSVADADALIPQLVSTAKLDKAAFAAALADGSAAAQVEHNSKLSMTAGVSGTPMIFANNQAIPGAIPYDALKQVMAN